MRADQGMGVGIDGSRACDAFGSGKPSGVPRHDVAQFRKPRRAGGQDSAGVDQGWHEAAAYKPLRTRNTSLPRICPDYKDKLCC